MLCPTPPLLVVERSWGECRRCRTTGRDEQQGGDPAVAGVVFSQAAVQRVQGGCYPYLLNERLDAVIVLFDCATRRRFSACSCLSPMGACAVSSNQ